ncbi:glycoside hydrolase family 3 C-terminal domain-containing protein [Autumnicola edwardsiae]|uniref:Glycoside hydrolase family 3 C-terminal domain-containing protein n=1 Tax=Autumnicola edwardsiae TaxID=3075594 RepID=A0ABU3CW99_9FLAO|nr:glycoside hydrolase family 3 C-terminal domain-containing protein [Zunongwangia sp. F297]MDT0650642.1 glycoside hydrolase family 3 C-terminal domain-containing protein [Zunongwangia sp. F297]
MNKSNLLKIFIGLWVFLPVKAQEKIFPDKFDGEIQSLINSMTLEEKVHQLATEYPNANKRLDIENLSAGECLHGLKMPGATVFPQALAMASTWDEALIEKMGNVVAKEARAYGIHQCYSPMISVTRDARWGRIEETFGEDPFLVGSIGSAYIKGLQGMGDQRFDKDHIIATAKHFVADGEPMAGDNGAAMDISEYQLQNVHLYPFRMAINEALVGSIMPAHHLLNGIPCHVNQHIMKDVLRDQYSWDGLVVSDNRDLERLKSIFNFVHDYEDAAKKALEAGVHQELAIFEGWTKERMYGDNLVKAVGDGIIDEELVNQAVAMVLKAKFALGLIGGNVDERFDMILHPENGKPKAISFEDSEMFSKADYFGVPRNNYKEILNSPAHNQLALEVARKSITLLKNDNQLLPLNFNKYKNIAVIGPNANEVRLGGYSSSRPKYFVTVLEGIKQMAGKEANVRFAQGCDFTEEENKIPEAVDLAMESDVIILVVGGSEETTMENEDTDDLALPGAQDKLIKAIATTGKPYVVFLINGRPRAIEWAAEHAPAILEGWYLGQDTGTAVAEVLFGKVNPGGKLPVTFPRNVGQVPMFYNKLETGRPRKIYKSDPEPLFHFGHGLSYTTFSITDINLRTKSITVGDSTTIRLTIKNTGTVKGDEVVQLYIHDLLSERIRPQKELRGFKRIFLNAGESRVIQFNIGEKQLEYWNGDWRVEPGEYEIMIGTSSEKLSKHKLTVTKA